jgi:hypothetical protein
VPSVTNRALQALLHSEPFLLGMLEQNPKELPPLPNMLCNLLAQMVELSSTPQVRSSISTLACQEALDERFNGGKSQEDSEEFLSFLLNAVLESAIPGRNPAESMRGRSDQTLECTHCKQVSTTMSTPFFTWQIPLPSKETNKNSLKLSELFLDSYTITETLDGDNLCFCSKCNKQSIFCKGDTISSSPNILCVQLKRFTLNAGTGQTAKLMTSVDIEDTMTLQCFGSADLESAVNYNLFCIVMHDGSRHEGHYLTMCRCSGCAARQSQDISGCPRSMDDCAVWCIFDDAYVSKQMTRSACLAEVLQKRPNVTPYLVFFAREASAHEASSPCPICCKNGSRVKEMARAMISSLLPDPSPAGLSEQGDISEDAEDYASDPSALQELIINFLQGRKYSRISQVRDHYLTELEFVGIELLQADNS